MKETSKEIIKTIREDPEIGGVFDRYYENPETVSYRYFLEEKGLIERLKTLSSQAISTVYPSSLGGFFPRYIGHEGIPERIGFMFSIDDEVRDRLNSQRCSFVNESETIPSGILYGLLNKGKEALSREYLARLHCFPNEPTVNEVNGLLYDVARDITPDLEKYLKKWDKEGISPIPLYQLVDVWHVTQILHEKGMTLESAAKKIKPFYHPTEECNALELPIKEYIQSAKEAYKLIEETWKGLENRRGDFYRKLGYPVPEIWRN